MTPHEPPREPSPEQRNAAERFYAEVATTIGQFLNEGEQLRLF